MLDQGSGLGVRRRHLELVHDSRAKLLLRLEGLDRREGGLQVVVRFLVQG